VYRAIMTSPLILFEGKLPGSPREVKEQAEHRSPAGTLGVGARLERVPESKRRVFKK
jgi:hypothetical protein